LRPPRTVGERTEQRTGIAFAVESLAAVIDAEPLFGVPWERLDLSHVEALLAEGDREPLLWEAKGTTLKRGEVREQLCGLETATTVDS
jgi:hypothetical protein